MRLLEGMTSTPLSSEELMVLMAEDGMSAKEMEGYIPSPYNRRHKIGSYLRSIGVTRLYTMASLFPINEDGTARCAVCCKQDRLENFPVREVNGHRLYYKSTCDTCLVLSDNPLAADSLPRKLRTKESLLRVRSNASLAQLPHGYLSFLYEKQAGKCFYSGRNMVVNNNTPKDDSMSIDRVVYNRPYEQGNILLSVNKVNIVKSDMTLEEMTKWTPDWANKITNYYANIDEYLWRNV